MNYPSDSIMAWGGKSPVKFCPTSGKTIFDKRGAQTAKNSRWKEEHKELRIYNCPDCNGFHLTSRIYKNKKPIKKKTEWREGRLDRFWDEDYEI
jgi:hypothetical protein